MDRRTVLGGMAAGAATLATPVWAQAYPSQPVRIVNGFPPGGATDIILRTMAEDLRTILGQAVVVENKGGANGQIAMEEVARAKPDGYTLLVSNSSGASSNIIRKDKLNFDPDKTFTIISPIGDGPPTLLCVVKELPVKDFKELVEYGRANPGKLRYASPGAQTGPHLDMFFLGKRTNMQMIHIPQKGGGGIVTALSNRDANLALINTAAIATQVKNGDVRPLATLSRTRLSIYPDVPTLAELGYPDVGNGLWHFMAAHADTPKDILDQLFAAVQKSMTTDRMKELYKRTETDAVPLKDRAASAEWYNKNLERFAKLIAEIGAEVR
jgi:tripartite-type tricarboxylate transporter receptor subunit TctC